EAPAETPGPFRIPGGRFNRRFTGGLHPGLKETAMIHALQMLVLTAFPLLVILGGLKDAASYTIPNWISLGLVGGFPAAALAVGLPLPDLGWCALAGLA